MTSRDFAYWLHGFFEILEASSNRPAEGLTEGQVALIKRHLALVFKNESENSTATPSVKPLPNNFYPGPPPKRPTTFMC